jgi:hypothetical protein
MFTLSRAPFKSADSNKVETPRTPIVMQTKKVENKQSLLLHFIPHGDENPFFSVEGDKAEPPSPQLCLLAPWDEAIEGSVRLRALWLRPQGSVLVEEALAEIPPGRDGPRRQTQDPPSRLILCSHREPVRHDAPIASSCTNGDGILPQKLDGI